MDFIKLKATTIALVLSSVVFANNGKTSAYSALPVNDSIKLNEVVVTGSMPSVNLKNIPMSITVINQQQIKDRLEPSLLPMLTEEVPGLFITQRGVAGYGVSGGSAGGMSIRGVGGSPTTGVLILIDGHPQYMGLMGHPIADSYQSVMTERVEVVRGPASVLYGSNAMGGVINIITKKQKQNGTKATAQLMYGSYNTGIAEVSAQHRTSKFFANLDFGFTKSDGHRNNMDFEQANIYAKAGYDINNNWTTFADINLANTHSSNPGLITNLLEDNDATTKRGVTSIAIENRYDNSSGLIKLYYNFGSHYINDGYQEGKTPLPYRFKSNDDMIGVSINQSYNLFEGNKTTAGLDYQTFGGKANNRFVNETPKPDSLLAKVHLNTLAGFINTQQSIFDNRLTLNAGIRLDYHEKNGSEWIPQFGLSYIPTATTALKAIISKGFRNPTIREMYMFPPRNEELTPERLMNYELSLLQSLANNRINLGLNLFYIKGDNMIQTTIINGKPLNINSGKIENKGIEVSATYQVLEGLKLSTNYSYLHMKHKIVASPEHKLYVSGSYNFKNWHIGTGVQYIANLYTTLKPEAVTEDFLLWNARANYKLNNHISLFAKGENLLNQKYEINYGFPMPGTTVYGGIRLNL